MKYLALLLLIAVPVAADAEQRQGGGGSRSSARGASRPAPPGGASPRIVSPRPLSPRGVSPRLAPQFRIGQPLQPAGWQYYVSGPRRGFRIDSPVLPAGQQWFGWRGDGRRERHWQGGHYNSYGTPYFGGYGGYGAAYPMEEYEERYQNPVAPAVIQTKGLLRLDVTPATGLQYYIDNDFFGTSADLGTEFELNAGARHIEIRAAGYKPLVFDTRIEVGEVVTYRGALEPLTDGQAQAPRQVGNRTIYVIRGCYIGNTPPKRENLRKGCDINRVTTR